MHLQDRLSKQIQNAFDEIFSSSIESVEFQSTRKGFEGDITVVIFPMLRYVKMTPATLGEQLGQFLVDNTQEVVGFNVVKGFLNIVLSNDYYMEIFQEFSSDLNYGFHHPILTNPFI
jgi:arginyl-tRNA synthetase